MSTKQIEIDDLKDIKLIIDKICHDYNVFFYGVFSNTETNTEIALVSNNISSGISLNNGAIGANSTSALNISLSDPSSISNNNNSNQSLINSTSSSDSIPHFKLININPNDPVDVNNYLFNCFDEFQQIPCKLLSKIWIKTIEPKKQSTYPYKGGESSKPYWWPSDARHKEPDHLKKDERISLLVSLLKVFKNKEAELINVASTINELSPRNLTTNTGDDFGSRKLSILKDMFRVVKNNIELNRESISVIKPGKKYSSPLYQRVLVKKKMEQVSSIVKNDSNRDEVKISHLLLKQQQEQLQTSTPTKTLLPPIEPSNITTLTKFHNLLNTIANNKSSLGDTTCESISPHSPFNISDFQHSLYQTPTKPSPNDSFHKYISKSNIDPKYIFMGGQSNENPTTLSVFKSNHIINGDSPLVNDKPHTALSVISPSKMNIVNSTPLANKLTTFNDPPNTNTNTTLANNEAYDTPLHHTGDQ